LVIPSSRLTTDTRDGAGCSRFGLPGFLPSGPERRLPPPRKSLVFRHIRCTGAGQEVAVPQGDKGAYTSRQKRRAEHIEEGYKKKGVSTKEAERRAWATVNKEEGGGKKSGSGRGKKPNRSSSRKGARKAAASRRKKSGGTKKRASSKKK
jgi:plasmid stabilization system protein ParE